MAAHAVAALFALAVARPAAAGLIIDQQNQIGNATSSNTAGVGQSFTPTATALDAVSVMLNVASNSTATLAIDLFEGAGFGGTLRGSSNTLTITSTVLSSYQFQFATPVNLTPGNLYTFRITRVGASSTYGVRFFSGAAAGGSPAPYSGGVFYRSANNGTADPGSDLVFAEGIATPEPSTLISGGIAVIAGLGFGWRRRARRAA